jgi:hypothetical protein
VNENVHSRRGRRRLAYPAWALLGALLGGTPYSGVTHEPLAACIQQRIALTVGTGYLEVSVDLTFFEEWSARERRTMDTDADGRISRAELEAYVKRLAPALAQQLKLRLRAGTGAGSQAGREVDLLPLYAPELDLLGNRQTAPAHHRLRLWFFAPTPPGLRAGDELVVEDRLWPQAATLVTLQVEGRDGWAMEAVVSNDPGLAPARPGEARSFHLRCLQAPPAPSSPTAISRLPP